MTVQPPLDDRPARYAFIDVAKGVALVAMVIYHTAFDLSLFRLFGVDIITDPAWTVFARAIASTFVGLVGVNLVLAHRTGIDARRFLRRLGFLVAAAGLVSLTTWLSDARTFVFFGILHQIALSSVLVLPFLRAPVVLTLVVAAAAIALPFVYASPVFDAPWLWWVGLSATEPVSIDYVPLFPWFGVALAGVAAGRVFLAVGTGSALARWPAGGPVARALRWMGRWTLAIYLIHQPVIFGLVMLTAQLVPPDPGFERARFDAACVPACETRRDDGTCAAWCACLFDGMYGTDLYEIASPDDMSDDQRTRWNGVVAACQVATAPAPLD